MKFLSIGFGGVCGTEIGMLGREVDGTPKHETVVIVRSEADATIINREGVFVEIPTRQEVIRSLPKAYTWSQYLTSGETPADVVIPGAMSHHLPLMAGPELRAVLQGVKAVLWGQNGFTPAFTQYLNVTHHQGIGNLETIDPGRHLAACLPPSITHLVGVFWGGATRSKRRNYVRYIAPRVIHIGTADPDQITLANEVGEAFLEVGLESELSLDIGIPICEKNRRSAAANTVGAIYEVSMGDSATLPEPREKTIAAMQEITQVYRALGIRLAETPEQAIAKVVAMGNYRCSTLVALEAARLDPSLLPVEMIILQSIELGEKVGVDMPTCRELATALHQKQEDIKSGSPS